MDDILKWLDDAREICHTLAEQQKTPEQLEYLHHAGSLITSAKLKLEELYGAP